MKFSLFIVFANLGMVVYSFINKNYIAGMGWLVAMFYSFGIFVQHIHNNWWSE